MAGSYGHIVTSRGNLVGNERFTHMIENLGDAYEMTEQMYGMIWYLATRLEREGEIDAPAPAFVEEAQQNYKLGLTMAKEANRRRRDGG